MAKREDKPIPAEQQGSLSSATPEPRGLLGRRDLLKAMSVVPAALAPLASVSAASTMTMPKSRATEPSQAAPSGAYQPKALNEHEWKTIRVLSDTIIPADERSGSATEAGVPEFIDDWLDFKGGGQLTAIRGGLTWLDMECNRQFAHDFVDCSEAQQKQILDRIAYPKTAAPEDAAGVAFFNHLRGLVVSGFYSSKMGVKDLPYIGNQMLDHWDGCSQNVVAKLGLKKGE